MKFIFITDTHGMASTPGSRLDDFPQALLAKMKYIGEYAKEINADGILHGGDWLHTPDVSENFIREFAKIIMNYPCPVYGVIGNHDTYGANPETFNRTAFGIAEGLQVFNRLYIDKPFIIKEKVSITGQDSHYNLDKNGIVSDYTDSVVADGTIGIHIVHGMLVEKEWPMVSCTTIREIIDCNADIILTGHEHTGFGVKTLYDSNGRKKIFCNPGSLARITAGTGDVRKDVRMAVITIEDNDFKVELVNLPAKVVAPASMVIDSEKLASEKATKEDLNNFLAKVKTSNVSADLNVYEALASLSEEIEDERIIEECRRQLQIAEEEINN